MYNGHKDLGRHVREPAPGVEGQNLTISMVEMTSDVLGRLGLLSDKRCAFHCVFD